MNVNIGTAGRAIPFLGIQKWDFRCLVFVTADLPVIPSLLCESLYIEPDLSKYSLLSFLSFCSECSARYGIQTYFFVLDSVMRNKFFISI
jgi:hypothetical protein